MTPMRKGIVLQIRCLVQFNTEFAKTFLRRDKKPSFRVYQHAIMIPQEKLAHDLLRLTQEFKERFVILSRWVVYGPGATSRPMTMCSRARCCASAAPSRPEVPVIRIRMVPGLHESDLVPIQPALLPCVSRSQSGPKTLPLHTFWEYICSIKTRPETNLACVACPWPGPTPLQRPPASLPLPLYSRGLAARLSIISRERHIRSREPALASVRALRTRSPSGLSSTMR